MSRKQQSPMARLRAEKAAYDSTRDQLSDQAYRNFSKWEQAEKRRAEQIGKLAAREMSPEDRQETIAALSTLRLLKERPSDRDCFAMLRRRRFWREYSKAVLAPLFESMCISRSPSMMEDFYMAWTKGFRAGLAKLKEQPS